MNVLQRSRLFFARIDKLDDPFEGSYPSAINEFRRKAYLDIGIDPSDERLRDWSEGVRKRRELLYANCWHINEDESAAMWDRYRRNGAAVAVRSTPRRLINSIDWTRWWPAVFIGMVRYADYRTESISEEHIFNPAMTKRRSFAHERELRAIAMIQDHPDIHATIGDGISPSGVYVPVSLDTLIESIWIAPQSPEWFAGTVRQAVRDSGLQSVEVLQSRLDEEPFF
jgi:hypothetical protein